jgi:hypothetical protein
MRNKRRIWKSPFLQRDRQNMLLRRQILYTVTPTTKPHYCGGEYSRNPRDQRERKKQNAQAQATFSRTQSRHITTTPGWQLHKSTERKGKKETKFHGKSKLLPESNWVQFQWKSAVKEVGFTSNGKWEVPELGRLWDMRYLGLVWRS